MRRRFEALREELLRVGFTPRRVTRYVAELQDHFVDLATHERASGCCQAEAAERASVLLGADAELARAMIGTIPRRSLATPIVHHLVYY